MTTSFKDNSIMVVSGNPGTGDITISGAVVGSQMLGSGDNGKIFLVKIYTIDAKGQSGSGLWELQVSTWTNSTRHLSRLSGSVQDGSSGPGTLVNFSAGSQHALVQSFSGSLIADAGVTSPKLDHDLILAGTTRADSSYGTLITDTDGTTIPFDMGVSNLHTVILGGDRILDVSNTHIGQRFLIRLEQDDSGSRLVTWWTVIKWQDSTEPILTTTRNKTDVFGFLKTGSTTYDGFIIGQNL